MISSILFFHLVSYFLDYLFFCQMACSLNLWTSRVTSTHYIPLFICSFFFKSLLKKNRSLKHHQRAKVKRKGMNQTWWVPKHSLTPSINAVYMRNSIHESHLDKMLLRSILWAPPQSSESSLKKKWKKKVKGDHAWLRPSRKRKRKLKAKTEGLSGTVNVKIHAFLKYLL